MPCPSVEIVAGGLQEAAAAVKVDLGAATRKPKAQLAAEGSVQKQ